MKAFLLAAGHGTRLRPHTGSIPKCLLPINGTPLLEIWLNLCSRHGIDEVLVNIHAHADAVAEFVRNRDHDLRIKIAEEPVLLGSAGTLRANHEWTRGEEQFWVFYADVLTCIDLTSMLRSHVSGTAATLGVYSVVDPERCGIVTVDSDRIVRDFVEKPVAPRSHLAFAGIMIGTQAFLDTIPDKPPADIGFDVLPRLVGRMGAYNISEYLLDIGTPENYHLAQRTWPGVANQGAA